jgi:predicted phosphodiesterase
MFPALLACLFLGTSLLAQPSVVRTGGGIFTTRLNPSTLPLPSDEDAFQFIIFGDRTGGDPSGLKVLRQAVQDTNLMDPDFVLTVGDLIQGYNRPAEWQQQADEFRAIMTGLSMPWFPVAGNHDVYWDFKDSQRPPSHHEKNYELNFGPLWYAFQHKNCGFIVMYSDEGNPETGEKGFNEGRLQNVSPQQFAFLKQALENFRELSHVFVALHHPRWIGGGYSGSNWPDVHQLLLEAGNVSAVFGGHIHRMRYDPQEGIDYFALATTGGHLSADLPEVGYLHHFNVVTVRPDSYSMATVPVGAVMDPKKFEPEFLTDVQLVRNMRPARVGDKLAVSRNGRVARHYRIAIPNPGKFPLEVALTTRIASDWRVAPDHQHLVIPPGKTDGMEFYLYRAGAPARGNTHAAWEGFQPPALEMAVDYLHESARIRMPPVPLRVDLAVEELPAEEFQRDLQKCLVLAGRQTESIRREVFDIRTDCARVESAEVDLPDGPFTLEAWVFPTALDGSRAVVAKTQSSEYALFLHDGFPQFDVHLQGRYSSPKAADKLPLNQWTHLAGVFDGQQALLYVNGKLAEARPGSGSRTRNDLPLYIGADPDGAGSPTRQFAGKLDEVRLSQGVRYAAEFQPLRRVTSDAETVLLLHLDRAAGPFLYDDSRPAATVMRFAGADIQPIGGE